LNGCLRRRAAYVAGVVGLHRMAARLRRALLLSFTCTLALGLGSAQACEKHLRGHSAGSDTAAQASQN